MKENKEKEEFIVINKEFLEKTIRKLYTDLKGTAFKNEKIYALESILQNSKDLEPIASQIFEAGESNKYGNIMHDYDGGAYVEHDYYEKFEEWFQKFKI